MVPLENSYVVHRTASRWSSFSSIFWQVSLTTLFPGQIAGCHGNDLRGRKTLFLNHYLFCFWTVAHDSSKYQHAHCDRRWHHTLIGLLWRSHEFTMYVRCSTTLHCYRACVQQQTVFLTSPWGKEEKRVGGASISKDNDSSKAWLEKQTLQKKFPSARVPPTALKAAPLAAQLT